MQRQVSPTFRLATGDVETAGHQPIFAFQQQGDVIVVVPIVKVTLTIGRYFGAGHAEYRRVHCSIDLSPRMYADMFAEITRKPFDAPKHPRGTFAREVLHVPIGRRLEHCSGLHFIDYEVVGSAGNSIALRAQKARNGHAQGDVLAIVPIVKLVFPREIGRHLGEKHRGFFFGCLGRQDCMRIIKS